MQDTRAFKVRLGNSVQLQLIPGDGRDRLHTRAIGHAPGSDNRFYPYVYLDDEQSFIINNYVPEQAALQMEE